MSLRRATAWVLACDAPECLAIAVPAIEQNTMHPSEHRSRHMVLNTNPQAFAAAREAGWVTGGLPDWEYYCPTHAHLANKHEKEPRWSTSA